MEPTDRRGERMLDNRWLGRPIVPNQGADRHAEVLVDVLWSFGILTADAAIRQGITHKRLAGYLGTSESTITHAVQAGLARGLLEETPHPELSRGGQAKVVWLSQKGAAQAPVIVIYNAQDAADHNAAISGQGNVSIQVESPGQVGIVPFSSKPFYPLKRSKDSYCPECHEEGTQRSGVCKTHGWASDILWGFKP